MWANLLPHPGQGEASASGLAICDLTSLLPAGDKRESPVRFELTTLWFEARCAVRCATGTSIEKAGLPPGFRVTGGT